MTKPRKQLTVLIADDEPVIRSALADLIGTDEAFRVVASADDAQTAITLAAEHHPDVIVVDVKMPGGGGERVAREVRAARPATRVIALSAHDDRTSVLDMLRAGASGYVVKGSSAGEILDALRRSVRGQASLSAEVTADVIHELVELLDRSERMSRELQQLDQTKRELIQLLSHELMTPITVVQGVTATMRSLGGRLGPEDAEQLADSVTRATDRLKRLVGNLSVTAALDREDVDAVTRPTKIASIVDAAIAEFPEQADSIRVSAPADLEAWADQNLAARALILVLENALQASPDGDVVEISVFREGDDVLCEVADRGAGVPEEVREEIFAAFVQGDSGLTRASRGVGIGLYLAGKIMAAHAGRMRLESRDGGGSVFTLLFPLATSSDSRA